jgi:hypothetical protein
VAELQTPDGQPVEAAAAAVNQEFARAMSADVPEPAAPPKRAAPAADETAGAAPKRRGRPPKSDRPRTTSGGTSPAAAPALTSEQRAAGVAGLVQVSAGFCLAANRLTGSDAFQADAVTLATAAPEWGKAAAEVAAADPKFARIVDKVAAAGPYGALIQVSVSTALQLARNHRPAAQLPGTTDPAELIARAAEQQQGEMADAA